MSDNVYTGAGMTGSGPSPYKVEDRTFSGKPTCGKFVDFIYYLNKNKGTMLKTMNALTNHLAGTPLVAFNDARRTQPPLRLALMILDLVSSAEAPTFSRRTTPSSATPWSSPRR